VWVNGAVAIEFLKNLFGVDWMDQLRDKLPTIESEGTKDSKKRWGNVGIWAGVISRWRSFTREIRMRWCSGRSWWMTRTSRDRQSEWAWDFCGFVHVNSQLDRLIHFHMLHIYLPTMIIETKSHGNEPLSSTSDQVW
jgi:hypothetical protein